MKFYKRFIIFIGIVALLNYNFILFHYKQTRAYWYWLQRRAIIDMENSYFHLVPIMIGDKWKTSNFSLTEDGGLAIPLIYLGDETLHNVGLTRIEGGDVNKPIFNPQGHFQWIVQNTLVYKKSKDKEAQ